MSGQGESGHDGRFGQDFYVRETAKLLSRRPLSDKRLALEMIKRLLKDKRR